MTQANVADWREAARDRLPRILFDYIDGAAFSETTAATNVADFDLWQLEQRVLTGLTPRDLGVTLFGKRRSLPMILGPVGFSGLFAPHGEVLAARAAHAAGMPFCLSNFGIVTLEELRSKTDGDLWFQLYLIRERELMERFITRAERASVEALCVTVDCAVGGVRERDIRSGFRTIRRLTPRLALAVMGRPRWCFDLLRAGIPRIGHVSDWPGFEGGVLDQAANLGGLVDPGVSWEDVKRLRDRWPRKLIIKGILHREDAEMAAAVGADGLIVSNHGGRELDGAPSSISALPEIVAAVGHRIEVLMDGGVRRGTHVVKALALGARGVLLGRAYAYGLAAAGERGVSSVIDMLATEIDVTLSLMGVTRAAELATRREQLIRYRPAASASSGEVR